MSEEIRVIANGLSKNVTINGIEIPKGMTGEFKIK